MPRLRIEEAGPSSRKYPQRADLTESDREIAALKEGIAGRCKLIENFKRSGQKNKASAVQVLDDLTDMLRDALDRRMVLLKRAGRENKR
jgi:hypothetical protein